MDCSNCPCYSLCKVSKKSVLDATEYGGCYHLSPENIDRCPLYRILKSPVYGKGFKGKDDKG